MGCVQSLAGGGYSAPGCRRRGQGGGGCFPSADDETETRTTVHPDALAFIRKIVVESSSDVLRSATITPDNVDEWLHFAADDIIHQKSIVNAAAAERRAPDALLDGNEGETKFLEQVAAVGGLGELLRRSGLTAQAELFFRKALSMREKYLGENHPDTLASMCNLAVWNRGKR